MNRGYRNYDEVEPSTDGWGNTAYSGSGYSDHVCRPVVVDAEGRKNPIIRYAGHSTEGYVMKAERIVEHISQAPPVVSLLTGYRYSPDEPVVDHKRYGQLGSAYDRFEKEENFVAKVQNEASYSRPVTKISQISLPNFKSNWRARPDLTGKDHGTGSTKYGDDSDLIRDKQSETHPQIYKGTNPIINNRDMYFERPRVNEGPILSRPTNDIDSAVGFLTEAIKPNYGTNTQTDVSRPIKAGPLSSIPWRTGYNLEAQDRKLDSGEDDWEKPKEQSMYGRDDIGISRRPTIPIKNKEEKAKNGPPVYFDQKPATFYTTPKIQTKEVYPSSETIDSSEARKRYGKLKNQPVPEDAYVGTIDCNEAVKKYNGAKVPW